MKNSLIKYSWALLGIAILTVPSVSWAQKETIRISDVKPSPSLVESVKREGRDVQMRQVLEALDGQLTDRINATRKFDIVAGSDLKPLHVEQEYANSGNVDTNDKNAAKQFKEAGAKYILVTTVDGIKDFSENSIVGETGQTATIRVLSLSAVAKIYNSTTAKLLESTNFQIRKEDRKVSLKRGAENATLSDELLVGIARDMADKIANRVADVIFPAKVIAKRDKEVTINRGDGTGIAQGQVWEVFALGEEMIDPDTKESLGREEVKVGAVKVTSVQPKFSKAEVLGEDTGIATGAILRIPK